MKKNLITFGLLGVTIVLSNVNAGKIITDADVGNMVVTPNKQFGFGGWNLDNVNVKIVNLADPHYNIGAFNKSDGSYSSMGPDYSFESDIYGADGSILGRLHGKDWPVGEPSGIKIINGDKLVANGKPENCIMTTSYLSGSFLNSTNPVPNICSGPFQSHKRFKVDFMHSTYLGDNAYGKSIDLVFNLQPGDTSTQRYQVFQKINNYTEKRLNGFKLEVLDANKMPNPALTISLGIGEYVGSSDRTDIWNFDEYASFSHGLWGGIDEHFDKNGFFDDLGAYYPVALTAGNTVLSYVGPMQGGNYQEIFGNWLPSKWHPMGIFFDHDGNPNTDAELLAFWGDPLHTGVNEWHKGFMDGWAVPTADEIALWTKPGGVYSTGGIEDTLNIGLNYIVNVGSNAAIGGTFTIRITPHFSPTEDQTVPSYVKDAPLPTHPGSERDNPSDGGGKLPAYDYMSLLFMIVGFLSIGTLIAKRKLA